MLPPGFDELLEASLPWDDGVVVMLRAYMDASTQERVLAVAGVGFGVDRAKKAEREWRALFGDRVCHMTDLHNRRGDFAGISGDEAGQLCKDAVAIVNRYASFAVVVSCDVEEVSDLGLRNAAPQNEFLLDAVRNPYPCCMHWAMGALGGMTNAQGGPAVAYVFERGDRFQGQLRKFLAELAKPEAQALARDYGLASEVFVDKGAARLLEAADVLAWEWARHVRRQKPGSATRKSLAALMEGNDCVVNGHPYYQSGNRYAAHYRGEQVVRFFERMDRLLTATSEEQIRVLDRQIDQEDAALR